jgi:hypothetical protein
MEANMNAKNVIKKAILIPSVFLLGTLSFQTASANRGVDDLRGRWDIVVHEPNSESRNFFVYVNDSQAIQNGSLATGCMESPESGVLAPLSMQSQRIEGGYNVKFASTVVPQVGNPFIIQFTGSVEVFERGLRDDRAEGAVIWGTSGEGTWEGTHYNRERTECPPVETPPFQFRADVYEQRVLFPNQADWVNTAFEGHTDIVSTGMLVQTPDGTAIVAPPYTDIFSPNVDFITSFRYATGISGEPISGQQYTMTLLDALGNPIPGTTKTDVWTGCFITPPKNLRANVLQNLDINLAWDPVSIASGFDPANGIGFYQIGIDPSPSFPGALSYGSNLIKSTYHIVPWQDFMPGSPGAPDGFNLGVGLNQLPDGFYRIRMDSFSAISPSSPGVGHECSTTDFGEALYFDKAGNSIIFR